MISGESTGRSVIARWVVAASLALAPWQAVAQEGQDELGRNAYFGELHIHSSWSIDAYVFGTRIGPDAAIRYARGEAVTHPGGFQVQLQQPLDFTIVMDHSEYTGAFPFADDPESPLRLESPVVAATLRFGVWASPMNFYKLLAASLVKDFPITTLQGPSGAGHAWKRMIEMANDSYEPGKFTTFPGWEWTATPDYKNLHRIVLFKDANHASETEFSSIDSTDPPDLWKWMAEQRAAGNDVMAISHNGNLSNGALYPRTVTHAGQPIDQRWAATRMRMEPVSEIAQVKGQSETTPALSPDDEFADFNVFVWLLLGAAGTPTDYGSYMRLALRDGIAMQGALGFNPYKFGFVSGSDSHSAASAYRNDDYFGEHGTFDDTPEKRLSPVKHLNMDNRQVDTAGLTGIWALENTRESLWRAIQRKETFATSGLRMQVRFFGGWDYDSASAEAADWVDAGYAKGVPMGGDLPASGGDAPTFIAWAQKDPTGPNLDRVQIVKGWARNGQSFEKIYDVTWAGDRTPDPATGKVSAIASTVDLEKATYTNTVGAAELKGIWTDPDFDPALDAFYYVRAIAIPVPRWTTIAAIAQGVPRPDVVPATVQDRAWSSPIWYTPPADARKQAPAGATVADLEKQGATALDDAALKALLVGKTITVRDRITGLRLEITFDADGRQRVKNLGGDAAAGVVFEARYEIRGGRLVTHVANSQFETTVYAQGGQYLAARNTEYGYANYAIEIVEP